MVKKSVRKSVQNNENTKKQLKNQEKAWNSETEKGLNEIDIEMLNAHNIIYCGLFLDMIKYRSNMVRDLLVQPGPDTHRTDRMKA